MTKAAADEARWCESMLPKVSRTFAACIGLLPNGLRHPVLIAYLLCRISDTIEDSADLPLGDKERLLAHMRACLEPGGGMPTQLAQAFSAPKNDDETLTQHADIVVREFNRLPTRQQAAIRPWVQEMCDGMAEFARQHARARPGNLEALSSVSDLDRYCYFVAGTVGHLLTDLFRLHHHRVTRRHYDNLKKLSTSFGLGLQLTNIIKDVADDRQRGWSFVPKQLCEAAGITPNELTDPTRREQAQSVMRQLIVKARGHLQDALDYCLYIPRSQYRIRLFCLTPLFFAIQTLRRATRDPKLLDPSHKVKITRAEVHRTIRMTFLVAPNNYLVKAYFRKLAKS